MIPRVSKNWGSVDEECEVCKEDWRLKEQIREDILEQMVADKVENWDMKNLSELGEMDNEDEETPSIYK